MKTIITHTLGIAFLGAIALIASPFISTAQTPEPQQGLTLTSTLLQMPDYGHFYQSSVQLLGVRYKEGRFVVAAGACVPTIYGSRSRGQWVFSETGQLIGEQDVCDDAGTPSTGLHDWSISSHVQFFNTTSGGTDFVRELEWSFGRGISSYGISSAGVSFLGNVPGRGTQNPLVPYQGNPWISNVAVTNTGIAIANFEHPEQGVVARHAIYRVPSFSLVRMIPRQFTPITGFGQFVVGHTGFGRDTNLYSVDASGTVRLVKTLVRGDAATNYMFDESFSPARLVLYVPRQNGGSVSADTLFTFELSGDDVNEVSSQTVASVVGPRVSNSFGVPGGFIPFAINGDYAVVGSCSQTGVWCGAVLEVWKGGVKIAETQLPDSSANPSNVGSGQAGVYPAEGIMGIAMSPSGNILAVNRYGAYLYRLGGVTPGGTITTTPPIGGDIPAASVNDFLSIASSYLKILQGIMGGGIPGSSILGPSSPAADLIYQQAFQR